MTRAVGGQRVDADLEGGSVGGIKEGFHLDVTSEACAKESRAGMDLS
jgi:hypothetical protein